MSRSKDNQTKRVNQLIECNIEIFLWKKAQTKYGGETIPRRFSQKKNWSNLWIKILKFYTIRSYCSF